MKDIADPPMRRMTLTIEAPHAGEELLWPIVKQAMREYERRVDGGAMGSRADESFSFEHQSCGAVNVRAVASVFVDLDQPSACYRPPEGWHCTRTPGHDGPCAAIPAYQRRVRDEHLQLGEKIGKLAVFMESDRFRTLDEFERARMGRQYRAMVEYSTALFERIMAFSGGRL